MKKRVFEILFYLIFVNVIILLIYRMYTTIWGENGNANKIDIIIISLVILAVFVSYADKIFPKWFKSDLNKK